jgi:phage terminase large subunit
MSVIADATLRGIKRVPFSQLANFTPKQLQAEALSDQFKYFLYGGAKGGAKSYWLRWRLLRLLMRAGAKGFHGIRAMLACEDYPSLMDRQVSKIDAEFPKWLGRLGGDRVNGLAFKLHDCYGGGALLLRNLDDPSKYDSSEFAFIGVDELTKNPYSTFIQLRTILRWPGFDDVRFVAGTNPGGIGHNWVKKIFINKEFGPDEDEADQFAFLQALATDNPHNSKVYMKQLNSIADPRLRKAYRDGDWDVFEGQYFGEWDRPVHVIPGYQSLSDRIYLCMDYGWAKPLAIYWALYTADGQRIHYREIYGPGQTPKAAAKKIVELTSPLEVHRIEGLYCDPSMWSSKAGEDSIAAIMEATFREEGFPITLIPANNDRVAGALKMREGLKVYVGPEGKPTAKMLFTVACQNAIRTIPALSFSKRNPEDWDTNEEDHAADAVRYGLTFGSAPIITADNMARMNEDMPDLVCAGENLW